MGWRNDKAKELKNVSDHSERRKLLSFSRNRYSAYGGDAYWKSREAKLVHGHIESIKKCIHEDGDQEQIIGKYQDLCCYPFGFYNFFNNSRRHFVRKRSKIKDGFDDTVRDISELEHLLFQKIEVPPIPVEKADILIQNSIAELSTPCIVHATDAEMLPWFVNSDITNETTASFLPSHFGQILDKDDFTGKWFYQGIRRFDHFGEKLRTDIQFRMKIQEALKKISGNAIGGADKFIQYVDSFQFTASEKYGQFREEESLYLDHKEYLALKESGFFEKPLGDEFTSVELEIISNVLARFYDSLKGLSGASSCDMVLWLAPMSRDNKSALHFFHDGEKKLRQEDNDLDDMVPGIDFIRTIQCANDYCYRRVLQILSLHLYDSYEKYPIIIDKDGNMLWPRKIAKEEILKMQSS